MLGSKYASSCRMNTVHGLTTQKHVMVHKPTQDFGDLLMIPSLKVGSPTTNCVLATSDKNNNHKYFGTRMFFIVQVFNISRKQL